MESDFQESSRVRIIRSPKPRTAMFLADWFKEVQEPFVYLSTWLDPCNLQRPAEL